MMSQYDLWIMATALLVGISNGWLGVFLTLRRQAMLADAISHSALLGIVLAFMISGERDLWQMMLGATLTGIITAWASQFIQQQSRIHGDAALGVMFMAFFSIAVLLISAYGQSVDLDQNCVLYGEITFVPLNTLEITPPATLFLDQTVQGQMDIGPQAFWVLLAVTLLIALFIALGFDRLQLISFQPALATTLGVSVWIWHYALMSLTAMSVVASFDAVGAILVVAFLVFPANIARLLSHRLSHLLAWVVVVNLIAVTSGYAIASVWDVAISAAMVVMLGVLMLLAVSIRNIQKL